MHYRITTIVRIITEIRVAGMIISVKSFCGRRHEALSADYGRMQSNMGIKRVKEGREVLCEERKEIHPILNFFVRKNMAEEEFDRAVLSCLSESSALSAAKIQSITKVGIKYGRNYKAIVFTIERFVTKCPPHLKLSGLYIVDSVVRACQKTLQPHEYANLVARFEEKIEHMFPHMLSAPQKDKEKMKKLIKIWKEMSLFNMEMLEGIEMIYLPDSVPVNPAVSVRNAKGLQAGDSPAYVSSPIDVSNDGMPSTASVPPPVIKNDPRRRTSNLGAVSSTAPATTSAASIVPPAADTSAPLAVAAPVNPLAAFGVDMSSLDPMTLINLMSVASTYGVDPALLVPLLVQSVNTAREKGDVAVLTQVRGTLGEQGCQALGLELGNIGVAPPAMAPPMNDFDYGDDEDDLVRPTLETAPKAAEAPRAQQLILLASERNFPKILYDSYGLFIVTA
ncbi:hypothetical protein BC830DRAFT_1206781 [Chytriomyces sp. MP71]|nr:hypothetical protein BC830DRAFT_1206781 [Chytriomyces sp. MP71]